MSYLEWSDSLNTGFAEIDAQHSMLLGIINELFEEITHSDNNARLVRIVAELMDYTQQHFTTEEALLESCRYPELAEHQQEHIHFMEKIRDFSVSLDQGRAASILPLEMFHFLQTWLVEHIMRTDRSYISFCQSHCEKE